MNCTQNGCRCGVDLGMSHVCVCHFLCRSVFVLSALFSSRSCSYVLHLIKPTGMVGWGGVGAGWLVARYCVSQLYVIVHT